MTAITPFGAVCSVSDPLGCKNVPYRIAIASAQLLVAKNSMVESKGGNVNKHSLAWPKCALFLA